MRDKKQPKGRVKAGADPGNDSQPDVVALDEARQRTSSDLARRSLTYAEYSQLLEAIDLRIAHFKRALTGIVKPGDQRSLRLCERARYKLEAVFEAQRLWNMPEESR